MKSAQDITSATIYTCIHYVSSRLQQPHILFRNATSIQSSPVYRKPPPNALELHSATVDRGHEPNANASANSLDSWKPLQVSSAPAPSSLRRGIPAFHKAAGIRQTGQPPASSVPSSIRLLARMVWLDPTSSLRCASWALLPPMLLEALLVGVILWRTFHQLYWSSHPRRIFLHIVRQM